MHILDNFPCFMTTAHERRDVAVIVSAFKDSVAELQESDFLPRRVASEPTAIDPTTRLCQAPDSVSIRLAIRNGTSQIPISRDGHVIVVA